MKNAFYFIFKALLVLKIFKFFKICDVTTSITNNYNNISRSKGNQTVKFGQVTGNNKRNIFAENEAGGLVLDLFLFFIAFLTKVPII